VLVFDIILSLFIKSVIIPPWVLWVVPRIGYLSQATCYQMLDVIWHHCDILLVMYFLKFQWKKALRTAQTLHTRWL